MLIMQQQQLQKQPSSSLTARLNELCLRLRCIDLDTAEATEIDTDTRDV